MPEPIQRTILERFDVPDSNYETVIMLVEIGPQVNTGLHTHPGFDAAYLLEGDLMVMERGQPDKPIHPGQSWHVRPGVVHEVKTGDRTAKVLAMRREASRWQRLPSDGLRQIEPPQSIETVPVRRPG